MDPASSPRLRQQQDFVLCPVTALAFFTSADGCLYLLAGEDSHVNVYRASDARLCGRFRALDVHVIHGIHVAAQGSAGQPGGKVLVWGAQSLAVFPQTRLETLVRGASPAPPAPSPRAQAQTADWIHDGTLSPFDASRGVVVTAHNEVRPFRVTTSGGLVLEPPRSPARSVLYSAATAWLASDCVLAVGGTVFGDVVVWKCRLAEQERAQDGSCHILAVFSGHEGSVFGVAIAPDAAPCPAGRRATLVASCSDDRTIRVWAVLADDDDDKSGAVGGDGPHPLAQARETGFGSGASAATTHPGRDVGVPRTAVAAAMGHVSRIWHVRFSAQTWPASIYSFGEDAAAQEWRLDLDPLRLQDCLLKPHSATELCGTLTHTRTVSGHSGKHIWAVSLGARDAAGLPLIATGGADGKILLIGDPAGPALQQRPRRAGGNELVSATVPEMLLSMAHAVRDPEGPLTDGTPDRQDCVGAPKPQGRKHRKDSFFFSYTFVSGTQLLATSSEGRLYRGDFGDGLAWTEVPLPDEETAELARYNVLKSAGDGVAFLGSASGRVYVYLDTGQVREAARMPAKVENILVLAAGQGGSRSATAATGPFRIVVTMAAPNRAALLTLEHPTSQAASPPSAGDAGARGWTQVPLLDGRDVVTSANFCDGSLVLGSRSGVIRVYLQSADGAFRQAAEARTGTKDAVNSIVCLPSRSSRPTAASFLATCRDGLYRVYDIELGADTAALQLRHEASPHFSLLTNAWFAGVCLQDADLILCGFRGSKFVVWNETQQREIAAVECAGSHRNYTYRGDPQDPDRLRFAFTKASSLNLYSQTAAPYTILRQGCHGREIRAVCFNGQYLATGAEDTVVRIWRYDDAALPRRESGGGLRFLAALKLHNTGIQCLKWLGRDYLVSCGGSEELFVWRVTTLDPSPSGDSRRPLVGVVCESQYPSSSSQDKDVRITSFDVAPADVQGGGMYISAALSNSTLKTYQYASGTGNGGRRRAGGGRAGAGSGWCLLAQGRYTGACPTQIRHLQLQRGDGRALEVLAAFADGTVSIWRASSRPGGESAFGDYEMAHVIRPHQSAVKCLDMAVLSSPGSPAAATPSAAMLLVTGGDDNAMAINALARPAPGPGGYAFCGNGRVISKAHAAATTAIRVVHVDEEKTEAPAATGLLVVTVSNDQRVKVWRIRMHGGRTTAAAVQLLDDRYSSVADPGDIAVLSAFPAGRFMVVGVGMESWTIGPG